MEIEITVAVEVGESTARRPSCLVLEGRSSHKTEVSVVPIKDTRLRSEAGEEQVLIAVVIHVSPADTHMVALVLCEGSICEKFETSISQIPVQEVPLSGRVGDGQVQVAVSVRIRPGRAIGISKVRDQWTVGNPNEAIVTFVPVQRVVLVLLCCQKHIQATVTVVVSPDRAGSEKGVGRNRPFHDTRETDDTIAVEKAGLVAPVSDVKIRIPVIIVVSPG